MGETAKRAEPPEQSEAKTLTGTLPAPKRAGDYLLLGKLGEGGMAEVHMAAPIRRPDMDAVVVLKLLRPALSEDRQCVAMFEEEGRLSMRLDHPRLIRTHALTRLDDRFAIVLEFLEGASLGALRRLLGGVSLEVGVCVLEQALRGLDYAHALTTESGAPLHVVHRDFNPNNIFLTLAGKVKVLDFGIAKTSVTDIETRTGVLKGTLRYMSPQAVLGEPVDHRSDIYSAGVMLWELLVGAPMWRGSEATVLHRIALGEIPNITELAPSAPQALVEVTERCLAFAPDARFGSAGELADALRTWLEAQRSSPDLAGFVDEHIGVQCSHRRQIVSRMLDAARDRGEMPSTAPGDPGSPLRQSRAIAVVAVAVALVLGGTMAWNRTSGPERPLPPAQQVGGVPELPGDVVLAEPSAGLRDGEVAASTPEGTRLSVRATPPFARLYLDERPMEGNPAVAQLERGNTPHVLRAEAEGYEDRVMEIVADGDQHVLLTLAPRGPSAAEIAQTRSATAMRAGRRPASPMTAATAAGAAMEAAPVAAGSAMEAMAAGSATATGPALRHIDEEAPWGE